MQKISEIFTELDRTLARRQKMAANLERAFKEAPEETSELLEAVSKAYYSGKIPFFWDVLANFTGAERGYGNDWFFTATEIKKEVKGNQK